MDLKLLVIFSSFIIFANSFLTFKRWQEKYNIDCSVFDNDIQKCQQSFDVSSSFVTVNRLKYSYGDELGLNGFAGVSFQEFKKSFTGLVLPNPSDRGDKTVNYSNSKTQVLRAITIPVTVPDSVDYRNHSLPVQNQKKCNSCWAFSAVESLEMKMKMKNPDYKTLLSAQYLVDCDTSNYGCTGGWPTSAFHWITQHSGNALPSSANYPYFGYKMKCRNVQKIAMNIKSIVQKFTNGNEIAMKEIVASVGPVVVAFHATPLFQLYYSGIFYDATCNTGCMIANHAIVIVGYGTDSATKKDYWIIKNSWGTSWGQSGYGFVERNKGNQCNIACWAMYTL